MLGRAWNGRHVTCPRQGLEAPEQQHGEDRGADGKTDPHAHGAEVQAELFRHRDSFRNYSSDVDEQRWQSQVASGYTREQARAEYIASRDEVRAMNGEDSGSAMLTQIRASQQNGVAVAKSSR